MSQTASSTSILELQGIRKVFDYDIFKKKEVVIENLSCRFPQGKCTGLFGHNGAGKTTTIRMIFGMIRPDTGHILFEGHPLKLSDKQAIGYMPETNKLPGALTPEEILRHQLAIYNVGGSRQQHLDLIRASLEEVGLWDHRKKFVRKLSKGMGRRLAWAQATIHKPKLVILDEPSSGLDPLGRRDMNEWIVALKQKGTSILLCTHDLQAMGTLCDDYHVIRRGRLVFSTLDQVSEQNQDILYRQDGQSLYQLKISGLTTDGIAKARSEHKLPAYQMAQQEALLGVLYFNDYAAAAQWLNFCNSKGMVVVNFGEAPTLEGKALYELFDGGLHA